MLPRVFLGSSTLDGAATGSVMVIGNFDGVHMGHRSVLDLLVSRAHAVGRAAMVYTFHPLPQAVLRPQERYPRILSLEDRVHILGELAVDIVCVERFTIPFSRHPADWFATEVLGRRLRPAELLAGYDFRFGQGGRGNVALLRRLLPELEVVVVPALTSGGEVVSSSRIREAVQAGRVEEARQLLGRPHRLRGTVVEGDHRGRGLGFPTANLDTETELLPPFGVYAVLARVDGSEMLLGVTSIGRRPTFGDLPVAIETHLITMPPQFAGQDLYGRDLEIQLVARLRDDLKFDSRDDLVAQIRKDVENARAVLTMRAPASP
jgi:riboflavin kinase / FMN adenylyltransferase